VLTFLWLNVLIDLWSDILALSPAMILLNWVRMCQNRLMYFSLMYYAFQ